MPPPIVFAAPATLRTIHLQCAKPGRGYLSRQYEGIADCSLFCHVSVLHIMSRRQQRRHSELYGGADRQERIGDPLQALKRLLASGT